MNLHVFLPHPELADYVDGIWVQEFSLPDPADNSIRILPGTSPVICIQYRSSVRVDRDPTERTSTITGLQTTTHSYSSDGVIGSVVVRFTPWGAARILNNTMREFTNCHVDLCALFGESRVSQLEEQVRATSSPALRASVVQSFLRDSLRQGHDQFVLAAAKAIRQARGDLAISTMIRDFSISERQLERRFLTEIGVSPKTFARIVRFQFAMQLRQAGHGWSDTAYDAGYSDQSHMVREFRTLVGTSPGKVLNGVPSPLVRLFNSISTRSGFNNAIFI